MKNKIYDITKYTTTVAIPALTAAYVGADFALDGALPYENQIAKLGIVICTLLGALVAKQSYSWRNSDDRFAGEIEVNAHDPSLLHSINLDGIEPRKLGVVDSVTLKVTKNQAEPPPPEID